MTAGAGISLFVLMAATRMLTSPARKPKMGLMIAAGWLAILILPLFINFDSIVPALANLRWNWLGKLLGIAACLTFIFRGGIKSAHELGLRLPAKESLSATIVASFLIIGICIGGTIAGGEGSGAEPDTETIIYQLTLPGLHEEIFHRAIVTALFASIVVNERSVELWNAELRISDGLSIAWFALVHGFAFGDGELMLSWEGLLFSGIAGIGFQWLYRRSGSVLPSILVHNLLNTMLVLLST